MKYNYKFVDQVVLPEVYGDKLMNILRSLINNVGKYTHEIWLFGSAAREELLCGSDLDILVINKPEYDSIRREISYKIEVLDLREDVGVVPVDIIVRTLRYMNSDDLFPKYVRRDKKVLWRNSNENV